VVQKTKSRLRLASIKKAAEWADVHPMTIRRWVAAGTLTGWQAAGARHIKVNLNELEEIYRPVGGAQ
jgi:excisionase family DNA binding protein